MFKMSCMQPKGSNISNFDNSDNEVDFDFFDFNVTNKNNEVIEPNFELNSPYRPTQFLTEVVIETKRNVNSPEKVTLLEDKEKINSFNLDYLNEDPNIPEYNPANCDLGLVNCIAYEEERENDEYEDDADSFESLSESTNTSDFTNITPMSSSNTSLNMIKQSLPADQTETQCRPINNKIEGEDVGVKILDSRACEEKELLSLVKSLETLSIPGSSTSSRTMSSYSGKSKPKRKSMTFTNDQLRKINRDNDILLKKIMAHAKPRPKPTSTVHNFHPTKTSAAINRLKQQKQIEHDNYILLNKIRDVKQTRKSIFETGCAT